MEVIEKYIIPTAEILDRIKPVLNIKSSESQTSWKERKEQIKKGKISNVQVHRTDKEKDNRKSRKDMRKLRGKF